MLKNLTLAAIAAVSLATASISMSANAEARPRWQHMGRWHQPHRSCTVKRVWRYHRWVFKKVCWAY